MEEIELILDNAKEQMNGAIKHLELAFSKIRAGKANPQMLDNVSIDYYGAITPLSQASNINTPDPRTISVQPWDKNMLEVIEKAIIDANLGFNPMNSKVSIRNARKEANDELKKLEGISEDVIKDSENEVQNITNSFTLKIDGFFSKKEEEILTV